MSRVGVIGIGHGKFGRRSDATVQELAFEAFRMAMQDAGIDRKELDGTIIAAVPEYHKQRSVAGVVQEYLNLNPLPTWLTEVACASGSAAIRTAWMGIQSGLHDVVAVIGCQKMTELSTAEILALMGRVGEVQWESVFGTTFPGYYAMFANRHMHIYGTTHEQLLQVAIKNHYYGARNENAMFQKEITMEKALASDPVASPFCVYDCCANADGAACLLLASEEKARAMAGDRVVWLDGVGAATASMSVLRRPELTGLPSASAAAGQAYKQAGVKAGDIKVAEVHDCFTVAEMLAYEDLGFAEKGQGGKYIEERKSYIGGGGTAVNVDGGLKSKGHPIGATGVSMSYEIVRQLRGECGERQVPDADVGLTHNVGGIGQYTFVHVYRRD